jgi:hypothetical protein
MIPGARQVWEVAMELPIASGQVCTVVGTRFASFREMPRVVLASELPSLLAADDPALRPSSILIGQGLDAIEADRIRAQCRAHGVATSPDADFSARMAGEREVHKTQPSNVLITVPARTGPSLYQSELMIHSQNELMLDHYSAMHTPAMVLVEAARQMFLAVTELYYLGPERAGSCRFLIDAMNMRFHLAVFPLPTVLQYQVLQHEEKKAQSQFQVLVEPIQGGRRCAEFNITFTAVDLRIALKQERIAAAAMLKAYSPVS